MKITRNSRRCRRWVEAAGWITATATTGDLAARPGVCSEVKSGFNSSSWNNGNLLLFFTYRPLGGLRVRVRVRVCANFCQEKPEEPENVRKMTCFDLPKILFVYYGLVSESVLFEHVPEMWSEGTWKRSKFKIQNFLTIFIRWLHSIPQAYICCASGRHPVDFIADKSGNFGKIARCR